MRKYIFISILYYQRASFPNEPKSKLAEFTPIALNARIMVEKVTLFPLSILEICALLTPNSSPSCSCVIKKKSVRHGKNNLPCQTLHINTMNSYSQKGLSIISATGKCAFHLCCHQMFPYRSKASSTSSYRPYSKMPSSTMW